MGNTRWNRSVWILSFGNTSPKEVIFGSKGLKQILGVTLFHVMIVKLVTIINGVRKNCGNLSDICYLWQSPKNDLCFVVKTKEKKKTPSSLSTIRIPIKHYQNITFYRLEGFVTDQWWCADLYLFWTVLKYHSRYYCQIPLQVMLLPIQIEWLWLRYMPGMWYSVCLLVLFSFEFSTWAFFEMISLLYFHVS